MVIETPETLDVVVLFKIPGKSGEIFTFDIEGFLLGESIPLIWEYLRWAISWMEFDAT